MQPVAHAVIWILPVVWFIKHVRESLVLSRLPCTRSLGMSNKEIVKAAMFDKASLLWVTD
jgi:hypothetical protein